MTDDPEIYTDIYADRPAEESRTIVGRLIATFVEHSPDPADPKHRCECGSYGDFQDHLARTTLLDLKGVGFEVRPIRFNG
jgi:hypothetical protein